MGCLLGPALLALGDGTSRPGCLRIADGRIEELLEPTARCDVALPEGSTVSPGLIDLHLNGSSHLWFNREPLAALEAASREVAAHGVTAFLPSVMTGPWEQMLRAATALSDCAWRETGGARPLGVHLEGPFLHPAYRRVHPQEFLLTPNPARIEAILSVWRRGRLRVTMAPEIEDADRAAAELRRRGVTLAAGHTAATYAMGNTAIESGFGILTHAFNAMPPLHHRGSSILTAYLLDPGSFCEVIADGIHVAPEYVALLYRLKGVNLILTTDAMPLVDGLVEEGGVARTKDGVIAGSRLTLDRAVRNLMAATGITLPEAVQCATWAPARALGVDEDIGLLAPGLRADLTVWDAHHCVSRVYVEGRLVYAGT